MTIHDKDKILVTKDVPDTLYNGGIIRKGTILFARGTTVAMYEGKPDQLPIWFRDRKGNLMMGAIARDSYELIELKYIPLYRILYE